MAEETSISWCDHTWSPVWGCTQISKAETGGGGCDNCYAMTLAHRFGYGWNGAPMREFGDHHWNEPLRWNARARRNGVRESVFPSMCDPFDKDWPDGIRERFWTLVVATPHLTWLLLTKRIGNARSMMADWWGPTTPANVWLGATIVNQAEADRDIPKLLATPAAVRFISYEPALGPIAVLQWLTPYAHTGALAGVPECVMPPAFLDWVIAGAESGSKARPLRIEWLHSIVRQCRGSGVAVHVKQLGAVVLDDGMASPGQHWPSGKVREPLPRRTNDDPAFFVRLKHPKGGDPSEWPECLRVQEFPR